MTGEVTKYEKELENVSKTKKKTEEELVKKTDILFMMVFQQNPTQILPESNTLALLDKERSKSNKLDGETQVEKKLDTENK